MHHVQSVEFPRDQWTRPESRAWLQTHDYKFTSVDEKPKFYHYRQMNPKSFRRFVTHKISHEGKTIDLVLGYK
jgi:hypothetical protein